MAAVTLLRGMFVSRSDAEASLSPPLLIRFQYNPSEVTRVLTPAPRQEAPRAARGTWSVVPGPPGEDLSMKIELDASDGLERGAPITSTAGVAPQLAALETLLHPAPKKAFGAIPLRLPGGSAQQPPDRLPFVVLVWGPGRISPVTVKSLTIRETSFNEALFPIHATAEIGLKVLTEGDFADSETLGLFAATTAAATRAANTLLAPIQFQEWV